MLAGVVSAVFTRAVCNSREHLLGAGHQVMEFRGKADFTALRKHLKGQDVQCPRCFCPLSLFPEV